MTWSDCAFCQIAKGQVSAHHVYNSVRVTGFLDSHPIRSGHIQLLPRDHFSYYDDIPKEVAAEILFVGQRLAPVLRRLFQAPRVAFLFSGGDIPHAHAHVLPLHEHTDITSRQYITEEKLTFRSPPRASEADLQQTAQLIRQALADESSDA